MVFVETPIFAEFREPLFPDDSYTKLQEHLIKNPNAGEVIQGSGGLRKLRWKTSGRGKRGGARVIYLNRVSVDQILLIFCYSKKDQGDLTKAQLATLKDVAKAELEQDER